MERILHSLNYPMRSLTLKNIILTGSAIILMVMTLQLVWLGRMYNLSAQFTEADEGLLHEIMLWTGIGAIVLLTLLTGLGILLYYFYRQRNAQEVQKEFLNN